MLHGVTMLQVEATPICDFLKSSALKPTACSMARLAARSGPSTTMDENARSAGCPFPCAERDDLELAVAINEHSMSPKREALASTGTDRAIAEIYFSTQAARSANSFANEHPIWLLSACRPYLSADFSLF